MNEPRKSGIFKDKDEIVEDVLAITGLEEHRIHNIYIYGSRVYGNFTVNSDYDIIVVASSMYLNHEMYDGEYNIHITTPDSFADNLRKHDIHCLECIYAPDDARVLIKKNYLKSFTCFQLDRTRLKKMLLTQASSAWAKGRRRLETGNVKGGAKSLFHSIRILRFGIQIMEHDKIIDFSMCNKLWKEIEAFPYFEWADYDKRFKQIKIQYVKEFKRAGRVTPSCLPEEEQKKLSELVVRLEKEKER